MILLPVDEAFAFDYLAVLYVKQANKLDVFDEVKAVENLLQLQVGERFEDILESAEFHESYVANANVFEAIEKAHQNAILAREVQEINYQRYAAKKQIQAKYWPKNPLMERKTQL